MRARHPIVFSFRERMAGPMARGTDSPRLGAERGRAEGTRLVGNFVITIDDLAACIAAPDHPARLGGTVSFADIADDAPIAAGTIHLYAADRETGMKQMRYRAAFCGRDGAAYTLVATKFIRPRRATVREQVTAYARLFAATGSAVEVARSQPASSATHEGASVEQGVAERVVSAGAEPVVAPGIERVAAAGIMVFRLRDLPAFLWSMRAEGISRAAGIWYFLAFSRRELGTPVAVLST